MILASGGEEHAPNHKDYYWALTLRKHRSASRLRHLDLFQWDLVPRRPPRMSHLRRRPVRLAAAGTLRSRGRSPP